MENKFIEQLSNLHELQRLIEDVVKKRHEELVPSVNLLCAVGLDENANSRILKELLSHTYKGKYLILESFVRYFMGDSFCEEIKVPVFANEEGRVDLLIKEPQKYAIIFENKIRNADMQKNQLARYIEKERSEGFADEQIYVVFLPPTEEVEPTRCGWMLPDSCCEGCDLSKKNKCENRKSLKEKFEDRYYAIDFRDSILTWLRDSLLPECRICEPTLHSALIQYIDYLESFFELNTQSKDTKMVISQAIKDAIGIRDDEVENMQLIHRKLKETRQVIDKLKEIEAELCKEYYIAIETKLRDKYGSEYVIEHHEKSEGRDRMNELRIHTMIGGISCFLFVAVEKGTRTISCGLSVGKRENAAVVSDILGHKLEDFRRNKKYQKGHAWIVYKFIQPDEAFEELCALIDELCKKEEE